MEVFDVAINMEIKGMEFYQSLAEKIDNAGFKKILNMMADEEEKHKQLFMEMKNKQNTTLKNSDMITTANQVFKDIKKQDFMQLDSQLELYQKALEIEKKSIDFYASQKDKMDDDHIKKTLDHIINEEKKHAELLENIIQHISKPDTWVEHAEFTIKEDY